MLTPINGTAVMLTVAIFWGFQTPQAVAHSTRGKFFEKNEEQIKQCLIDKNTVEMQKDDVLIAIQTEADPRIHPILILRNGDLQPVERLVNESDTNSVQQAGLEIEHFKALYDLRTKEEYQIIVDVNYTEMSSDECYWYGEFKNPQAVLAQRKKADVTSAIDGEYNNPTTILANKALPIKFYGTQEEVDIFYKSLPPGSCVYSGDYEENFGPPCELPKIYATSDLNHNGRTEYWHDIPYMWDVGFGVAEIVNGKLMPINEICHACD